ncbi:uncharacterized protein [Nicotiana sylvestris]|uniref:uncharacterized protein n=1 Tax=Nicotiana sylvestris TaxID=4096 RepID=UPI00388CC783
MPMILKQWELNFKLAEEPLNAEPIWVVFPNLPIQYWDTENLGRISSCLGKPICTDKLTTNEKRISYARVLIEMDVAQPLPDSVTLEEPDEYCQECLQIARHKASCKEQIRVSKGSNVQQLPRRQKKKIKQQWKAKPNIDSVTEVVIEVAGKPNEELEKENQEVNTTKESQIVQKSKNRGKQKMVEVKGVTPLFTPPKDNMGFGLEIWKEEVVEITWREFEGVWRWSAGGGNFRQAAVGGAGAA